MKHYSITISALVLCVLLGCGKGYVPMSGTVTFADNGEPVPVGTVIFESGPHHARGHLDEQGRYSLDFDSPGSGLPKGTYNVYVTGASVPDGSVQIAGSTGMSERTRFRNLLDPKYNSATTSGLTVVVDGSSRTFDFRVDRARN